MSDFNWHPNYVRKIAFVSDTHFGSRYAPWPEGMTTPEGNLLEPSEGQRTLNSYWRQFIDTVDAIGCDTVFHNGDVIEGTNRKEFGNLLMNAELETQKEAAAIMLEPLFRGRKAYMLKGSGYHHSLDTDVVQHLADKMGVVNLKAVANCRLTPSNRILHISHGESAAQIYRTMLMDREGIFHLAASGEGKIPKADLIIHGHLHHFIHIDLRKQHLVQLPGWKLFSPDRIHLKNYPKMQPDIGGVIILIDDEERITVWKFIYPPILMSDCLKEA
jgi:calcineurin-like phosphoesterase family protein